MVRAPFEVSAERGSFKVKVRADSVRRAEEVLRSEYPGSEVRLVFPIDGDDFFADHCEYEEIEGQTSLQ